MKCTWALLLAAVAVPLLCQAEETGKLTVKANPGRAGVFVDGKYVGPAANFRIARTYAVPAGEHEIKLVDPRYEEVTTKVTVTAGKKTTIAQTLKELPLAKPPFGRLRTENTDKFAAVYVNDKYMGHVDEFSNFAQGLLLNPGDYSVKIVPTTGQPTTQTVKIETDKTAVVK
ncbi:MAG: PEGA domain-containing protein [Acidobacteriia bacterium]|nr:PEGA domain-containing protein [Terriglobia bacterium]